jgi:proline iminopeptidase
MVLIALVACSATARAEDGSFTHDGVVLHYRTVGSGSPVILLSGGPGMEVDYVLPVADFLPASYQHVFLEQRGTGRSRVGLTSETMTLENVVEDPRSSCSHQTAADCPVVVTFTRERSRSRAGHARLADR